MNDFSDWLNNTAAAVNTALDHLLPPAGEPPQKLHEAMRYSLFAGGKRLRPALCIAAAEACGGNAGDAINAAAAIEMLHTYTLIHDDLPAMDNDELRRGRPTCHIQFDEATAILAGDALLTLTFEILADIPQHAQALIRELARATGSRGVIGGQAVDIESEGKPPNAETVQYIHRNKTAALIRASCVMGGICAGATEKQLEQLAAFGENTGLAFQLIDDILDEIADARELGKNTGVDKARGKLTWPAVYGLEQTRADAATLEQTALAAVNNLPSPLRLKQIAAFITQRNY